MLTGSRPIKFTGTPTVAPAAASGIDPSGSTTPWAGGGYTQIISAANVTQDMLLTRVFFVTTGTVAAEWELHIAFGAAASEVDKIKIPAGGDTASGQVFHINLPRPLFVPSGTRISCRTMSSASSAAHHRPMNVKITLMPVAGFVPD